MFDTNSNNSDHNHNNDDNNINFDTNNNDSFFSILLYNTVNLKVTVARHQNSKIPGIKNKKKYNRE